MRSTLSNTLLQKLMTLVLMTETGPEVYVATITTIISDSYYSLVDTLKHMKSLKIKYHSGRDVADLYDAILVNVESLESDGAFKPEQIGYIIRIFENTSDSIFHLWATQKYKEVMEFVKKPLLCDEDVMHTDYIIICGFLVQKSLREYSNNVKSKRWEPTDIKKMSKDKSLLLTASTVAIESQVNKTVEEVYCKIRQKGKDNKSGVGSSTKSGVTCHSCGKKGHSKSDCKSNRNGSNGVLSKTSTRKLPKWVTKKPMISDVENLTTANMNRNKNHYKWCTSCNDSNGAWGYHWKIDHMEWKEKQGQEQVSSIFRF